MKETFRVTDALVLSTCNRTEIYYSSERDIRDEIIALFCSFKGVDSGKLRDHFRHTDNSEETVRRLFRVSLGLEAQVVGDLQISNQVKRAYQLSADLEMAGPVLHRVMHTIFFANKRVVQETSFRDGAASVSYAATELIEDLTSDVIDPRVLLIGTGEIGKDVCKNLIDTKLKQVTVVNRTEDKARELAHEYGFKFASFAHVREQIMNHDVIITSLATKLPVITPDTLEGLNMVTFKYFVDLSVPRSVDQKIEKITGVVVYNIDDIQNRANEALDKRLKAIPAVEKIISESLDDFKDWTKEMEISPVLNNLKSALDEIRKEEIKRYLKELDSDEVEKVEMITKNIMQKIIKMPAIQLRAACKRGEAESLIDVLNDLFNLERQPTKK
jgi:glutamyl-tRNA reductase